MTVLVVVLVAALVVTNYVWLRELRKRDAEREAERQRLLNRVLHPEVPQVPERDLPPDEEIYTREADDFDKVGTIQIGTNGD